MTLSEFLKSSPSLRIALQGEGYYQKDFLHTLMEYRFIRDNTDVVFAFLARNQPHFHTAAVHACSDKSARDYCVKTFNLIPPAFSSIEEEGKYYIHYIKKLIVSLVTMFGQKTALTYLSSNALSIAQVAIACSSSASWIEKIDSLPPREVECLQMSAIANFVMYLSFCNYPTSVYRGVNFYLTATEIDDNEYEEEILPRIATIRRTNEATTLH